MKACLKTVAERRVRARGLQGISLVLDLVRALDSWAICGGGRDAEQCSVSPNQRKPTLLAGRLMASFFAG
jgi:hypothetical protein